MAVSPLNIKSDLVTFSIQSNGKEIDLVFQVYSIFIDKLINKNDIAEITILADSSADGISKITGSDYFSPGSQIDISLGYDGNNEEVFTGSITAQVVQVNSDNTPLVKIICEKKNNPVKKLDSSSPPALEVTYGVDIIEIELALNEKYKSSLLTKYTGYIVFQGSTLAKENSLLSLNGFGESFNGSVFIAGLEHKISSGNWLTKVKIGVIPEILEELKPDSQKSKE